MIKNIDINTMYVVATLMYRSVVTTKLRSYKQATSIFTDLRPQYLGALVLENIGVSFLLFDFGFKIQKIEAVI